MLFKRKKQEKRPQVEKTSYDGNDFEMLDYCIDRILHTLDAAEYIT